jgi:hypothetical protein
LITPVDGKGLIIPVISRTVYVNVGVNSMYWCGVRRAVCGRKKLSVIIEKQMKIIEREINKTPSPPSI